jgi:hypothetical protein
VWGGPASLSERDGTVEPEVDLVILLHLRQDAYEKESSGRARPT